MRACPIVTNGGSTGLAPIHVKSLTNTIKTQNKAFFCGENFLLSEFDFRVSTKRIRIAPTMADTPPNLDGMDRRIA